MSDIIQIRTTTDSQQAAMSIAQDLVATRFAACVQVSGPVTSVYRWEGDIETNTEWICTAKTTRQLYARVEQRIRILHSYDEPEILAVEISQASAGYQKWLRDQVVDSNE